MSRNELVEAYLVGKISRRGFMRGMAATGASLTMAAAAADQLRVSAQDGDDSGDGPGGPGGPYGPYDTPTLIPITEEVVTLVPITEEVVTQVPVTEEVVTQVPVTQVVKATKTPVVNPGAKATKTPVVKATEAPKTGGGTTGGGTTGGGTTGGGGATTLPDTGAGQNTRSGLMGPLSLAASAAAAAIAFRVRSFRKPAESDIE